MYNGVIHNTWIHNRGYYQLYLCRYCKQVVQISNEIVRIGLEEEEKRRTDRESFYNAHKQALESNQEESVLRIKQYETEKAKVNHLCLTLSKESLFSC